MIELKKVTLDNVWEIVKLSVKEDQKGFVASNICSIAEAYATNASGYAALPFGIYSDKRLIGFVMFGYGDLGDEDEPKIAKGNYVIWRFMIDQNYQSQGYGKEALKACLAFLKTMPCGDAKYCWLSYEPENLVAKSLYTSAGFHENGDLCGEEIVSVMAL